MANRATVTYNGKTISTEDKEGNFDITYNGSTIATVGAGQTKTLNCANQVMKTNVIIGGKTLNCAKYKMATNINISVISLFPSQEPTSYSLINTYTTSQTWTAPESGYFQIEVFGASGNGGTSQVRRTSSVYRVATGGGGGGGGYSCSRIKLNKGDTIALSVGAVGSTTTATINSTIESYSSPEVTSGADGAGGTVSTSGTTKPGLGGAGGTASYGNYSNINGGAGSKGSEQNTSNVKNLNGGTGGTGSNGAPNGGDGASYTKGSGLLGLGSTGSPGTGSPGFFKISRGNTNTSSGGSSSSTGYTVKYSGDLIDCTIEVYDSTGIKRSSNAIIYANDYILIDPGYTVSSIPSFSVTPSTNAQWTTQLSNGKIKMSFTSISGAITISAYL